MKACLPLFLLALLSPLVAADSQLAEGDRLILSAHKPDALMLLDREGEILWKCPETLKHPQQVHHHDDGRLLCATIDGAVLIDAKGETAWRYAVPRDAENATARFLDNGHLLVAHEGKGELVQLDEEGEGQQVTRVEPLNDKKHGQFRYCGVHGDLALVPMTNANTYREIHLESGKVLWEIKDIQTVTSATVRPDGGRYIAHRDHLRAYDTNKQLEWTLSLSKDLGLKQAVPPTGMVLLPQGHVLLSLWHTHDDVPDIIEIDPVAKALVKSWHVEGIKQAAGLDVLPAGNPFQPQ